MTQCPNKWGVGSDFHLMKKTNSRSKATYPWFVCGERLACILYNWYINNLNGVKIKSNFLRDWFVKLKMYQENYDPRQFAKIHIDVSWEALVKPCRLQVATL